MSTGRLFDTYAAALQHDLADVPEGTKRLGVVRGQTPWLAAVVDENVPELGPPRPLLDEVKDRQQTLLDRGVDDATAHNRAMDDVEYDRRYRDHIESSDAAQAAMDRIRTELDDGLDIALVCYENTDEKRCHRTILRDLILVDR